MNCFNCDRDIRCGLGDESLSFDRFQTLANFTPRLPLSRVVGAELHHQNPSVLICPQEGLANEKHA